MTYLLGKSNFTENSIHYPQVREWRRPVHIDHTFIYEYVQLLTNILSVLQTEQARQILLRAIESPNSTVQAIAFNAIAHLDTQALDDRFRRAIVTGLSSSYDEVVADAACAAGNHCLRDAVPELIEIVEIGEWPLEQTKKESIRALKKIRDERAIAPLKLFLEYERQKECPENTLDAHRAIDEIERGR